MATFAFTHVGTDAYKALNGIPYAVWTYQLDSPDQPGAGSSAMIGLEFSSRISILDPSAYPDVAAIQNTTLQKNLPGGAQNVLVPLPDGTPVSVKLSFLAPADVDLYCAVRVMAGTAQSLTIQAFTIAGSLAALQHICTGPAVAFPSTPPTDPGGLLTFKGVLPYATELFGTYQPLVGWQGNRPSLRVKNAGVPADQNSAMGKLMAVTPTVGILSPVGLVHLYREYFFDLTSFLGPPVGHVWVSPGGTVEMYEVSTKQTTIDQTVESSIEQTKSSEDTLTDADDIADAVKQDNLNNTNLAASLNTGVNFAGIFHADGSASFSNANTRDQSQEDTHTQTRTQSEKLSSEIRQNYKTTFRTVTQTTDTTSRRYLVQNKTDGVINYELRRKMRKVAIQLQHIGTRLSWQVYLDDPGRTLGLGGLVETVPASGAADAVQPPTPLEPQKPQDSQFSCQFPLMAVPGLDNPHQGDDYAINAQDQLQSTNNPSNKLLSRKSYSVTPPQVGYCLTGGTIKTQTDASGSPAKLESTIIIDDPGQATFEFHVTIVNFGGGTVINLDLTLNWAPPAVDPGQAAYNAAFAEYQRKLFAAQRADYANAIRDRLNLVSNLKARPADDLRAEERDVVYGTLVQQLIPTGDIHVSSELVRSIFDVDEMLYFVAPDYWRPQTVDGPGALPKVPYPPSLPDPKQDPMQLTGDVVLGWYGYQAGASGVEARPNYLITEDSAPAPLGSSLGWLIQTDGDERRNEFLNAGWVKAVLPVRPGHELEALQWLRDANVEGETGLSAPYVVQPGDPPSYAGKTIGDVLNLLATELMAANTDITNTLATETVYQDGFDPLEGGFRVSGPYQIFDQWIEVLPTDQVVAVNYDPSQHGG